MEGEKATGAHCRDVSKTYRRATGEVPALDRVDVDFRTAAVTALVGPSGSGKSSLLRIVAGLDKPDGGTMVVGDTDIAGLSARSRRRFRRARIGYVFQRPSDNLISYLTVVEHMDLAARIRGVSHEGSVEIVERLGIAPRGANRPHELSGGEQQRLAFGLAAIGSPALVIADEPTAELDHESGAALMDLVTSLALLGTSVIIATHDPEVAGFADVIVTLDEGKVVS
jgi:putative ABC transport system ATP-binding protein